MHRLHEVHITGETLVWDDRENVYYVGPESEFRDCHITIAVPARALAITRTRFIGCTLQVKRQLTSFRFYRAYIDGCRLRGRFVGCEFGRRFEDEQDRAVAAVHGEREPPLYWPWAGIVDTDLSAARLVGCRFVGCDLSTLQLPSWPCFTVPDPEGVRERALELPWPGLTHIIPGTWDRQPPETAAVTYDARDICKRDHVTEAELRAVVEQIPGVIM